MLHQTFLSFFPLSLKVLSLFDKILTAGSKRRTCQHERNERILSMVEDRQWNLSDIFMLSLCKFVNTFWQNMYLSDNMVSIYNSKPFTYSSYFLLEKKIFMYWHNSVKIFCKTEALLLIFLFQMLKTNKTKQF